TPETTTSVATIVRGNGDMTALVGVERHSYANKNPDRLPTATIVRRSFRIEPGPRFLRGEWIRAKNELIERPVTAATYEKEIRTQLSEVLENCHPFDEVIFNSRIRRSVLAEYGHGEMRIAGRE